MDKVSRLEDSSEETRVFRAVISDVELAVEVLNASNSDSIATLDCSVGQQSVISTSFAVGHPNLLPAVSALAQLFLSMLCQPNSSKLDFWTLLRVQRSRAQR